jgi:sulfur carrier protein
MIQIQINSKDRQIPDGTSMAQLIQMLDLANQRIAIEVNEELVPRSTFESHLLTEKDRVEIIQAIGGG